jgi:hypothetical protein
MFYPQKSRCGPGKRRPSGISLEILGKVQIGFHFEATIKNLPCPRGSHDDLLVPEPIAIRLICHGFFFLIGAFRDPPKQKKPNRSKCPTGLGCGLWRQKDRLPHASMRRISPPSFFLDLAPGVLGSILCKGLPS